MVESSNTKKFEIKKWSAVALWAWGKCQSYLILLKLKLIQILTLFLQTSQLKIVLSARIIFMKPVLSVRQIKLQTQMKNVQQHGVFATMLSISTVLQDGLKLVLFVLLTTKNGIISVLVNHECRILDNFCLNVLYRVDLFQINLVNLHQ